MTSEPDIFFRLRFSLDYSLFTVHYSLSDVVLDKSNFPNFRRSVGRLAGIRADHFSIDLAIEE